MITLRNRLMVTTLLAGVAGLSTPAWAKDAAAAPQTDQAGATQAPSTTPNQTTTGQPGLGSSESEPNQAPASTGDVVVTGSLIRNPNITSSSPVSVIGQDEIQLRQTNTAEEVLRTLPGAVPSIGSAVNNGNGGQSFVNLRGLGSNRNVVLIDGIRIVPGDLAGRVDLNNIPLALVERVDALTGGASTTYGADAVAGVVNFITRKDFAGVDLSGSQQITGEGDGNFVRGDLTIGANLDDGRGNVVFSVGYQESDPVYQGARSFSVNNIDSFSGAAGGSGTSVPSRFSQLASPLNGITAATRQINPATGALVPTFALFNFNPFNIFQTPFKRFNMFGQANYRVSDGIEFYTRGLFSKNNVQTIIAPSGVFNSAVIIPVSNPYLPAAAAQSLCLSNGDADPGTAILRPTAAQCTAARLITNPALPGFITINTNLARRTTEVGPRVSDFQTTIFDYHAGIRGDITSAISYDVGGSYGESTNRQSLQGYVLTSRARAALYATNTATCLASGPNRGDGGNIADISAGTGCVPINVFGDQGSLAGNQTPYITAASTSTVETKLGQAHGVINGSLGISSPFADTSINFAAGAEYRRYRAAQSSDTLAQTPGELGGAGGAAPTFNGGYEVTEGFGELVVPLVGDRPFLSQLQVELGVRQSHYKIFTPTAPTFNTTTYKAGGSFSLINGFKIRGDYQRAVRAPNIGELFTPVTTGLTNLATDPCAGAAPNANANLRAICLAQGAPAGSIGAIANPTAGQANLTSGGNVNVGPEKANTYTVGAVIQVPYVRNVTITADYYNIKVDRAISSFTPGDILASCFTGITAASAQSTACQSIRRNPATGGLDGDPATTPGLFTSLSNLGQLLTDGIDATITIRQDLGFGRLNVSGQGNWTNRSKFKASPASLYRECTGFYSVNCGSIQPEFQWNVRSTLTLSPVDFSVLWRHIDKVRQEPDDVANGSGPAFSGVVPAAGGGTYNFGRIPAYNYIDLAARVGVNEHFEFTFTAQNVFNKKPPLVGSTIGSTSYNSGNTYPSTYDALGTRFAAGARLRF